MEEKVIDLGFDEYQSVIKLLKSNQQKIYFRCKGTESIISIDNKTKEKNNEKNIVELWMKDIIKLAEDGYQETREECSEINFSKIISYCQAIVIAVTS